MNSVRATAIYSLIDNILKTKYELHIRLRGLPPIEVCIAAHKREDKPSDNAHGLANMPWSNQKIQYRFLGIAKWVNMNRILSYLGMVDIGYTAHRLQFMSWYTWMAIFLKSSGLLPSTRVPSCSACNEHLVTEQISRQLSTHIVHAYRKFQKMRHIYVKSDIPAP